MRFENSTYDEERALYGLDGATVVNCRFDGPADGESAIKECRNIEVKDTYFNLRYPLWHVDNVSLDNCQMTENCRAAIWYSRNMRISDSTLNGIKVLRECENTRISGCEIKSDEFAWMCNDFEITDSHLCSVYPFLSNRNVRLDNVRMEAKYAFQYAKSITLSNCDITTKDSFWNSSDITVTDSVIRGEYLGWYSRNLHLIRCHIEGTQPLCYCENLILEDCTMENCDRSFEKSSVTVKVSGRIDGIKNPKSGKIVCDEIGELIMDSNVINVADTVVLCDRIGVN